MLGECVWLHMHYLERVLYPHGRGCGHVEQVAVRHTVVGGTHKEGCNKGPNVLPG